MPCHTPTLARHRILFLFSAGLVLPIALIAQRSARTTPRPGAPTEDGRRAVSTPNPRQAVRDLQKAKPKYDVSYIKLAPSLSPPASWKPTPNPIPGGINCDYVYGGGSTQWVSAIIWNDGGPAPGMVHVAPLLVRTDVAGDAPSLASVPVKVAPPPPGGNGTVKLYYRVPNQVGKYQMRIFIAESQNHEGFDDEPFRGGEWRTNYCPPRFHVVLPKSPGSADIIGATLHAANTAKCEDSNLCCTTLSPDWLSIRVKNTGDSALAPFTVDVKVLKGCNKGTAVKADTLEAGAEVDLKAILPSFPGFQKCLYGSSGSTKTMDFEISLSIRNSDSSEKILTGTLFDCPWSGPPGFQARQPYSLFKLKQPND